MSHIHHLTQNLCIKNLYIYQKKYQHDDILQSCAMGTQCTVLPFCTNKRCLFPTGKTHPKLQQAPSRSCFQRPIIPPPPPLAPLLFCSIFVRNKPPSENPLSAKTWQMQRLVIRARTPARRLTPCLEVHLPILALELAGEKVELTAPAAARGGDDGVSWFLLIFHLSFF